MHWIRQIQWTHPHWERKSKWSDTEYNNEVKGNNKSIDDKIIEIESNEYCWNNFRCWSDCCLLFLNYILCCIARCVHHIFLIFFQISFYVRCSFVWYYYTFCVTLYRTIFQFHFRFTFNYILRLVLEKFYFDRISSYFYYSDQLPHTSVSSSFSTLGFSTHHALFRLILFIKFIFLRIIYWPVNTNKVNKTHLFISNVKKISWLSFMRSKIAFAIGNIISYKVLDAMAFSLGRHWTHIRFEWERKNMSGSERGREMKGKKFIVDL